MGLLMLAKSERNSTACQRGSVASGEQTVTLHHTTKPKNFSLFTMGAATMPGGWVQV